GPHVKIRIKPDDHEYTISKNLLCAESQAFLAMFDCNFLESEEQTATLEEMEIEALVQWLHLRDVNFDIADHRDHISAAMEVTQYIHHKCQAFFARIAKIDKNTYYMIWKYIVSATFLPQDHPVALSLQPALVGISISISSPKRLKKIPLSELTFSER
ncbi:hypothetical protein N7490_007316, partial [Penicillium lividum]